MIQATANSISKEITRNTESINIFLIFFSIKLLHFQYPQY